MIRKLLLKIEFVILFIFLSPAARLELRDALRAEVVRQKAEGLRP